MAVSALLLLGLKPVTIPRRFGLEQEFDSKAAGAYDRMGEGLIFKVERALALRQLEALSPNGTLLDAGCGPGYLLREIGKHFPGLNLIGLDNNPEVIALAQRNLKNLSVELLCAGAEEMPVTNESLDFIITTGTLHHWQDVPWVLNEFHRALKPGGILLIMDLRRDCPLIFWILIHLSHWFMAAPIRRVNGPVGSFLASFSMSEIQQVAAASPLKNWRIKKGFGWYYALGTKQ
jgi:ubiquinone/menaquinone biosynthesis C-methylase UbiE